MEVSTAALRSKIFHSVLKNKDNYYKTCLPCRSKRKYLYNRIKYHCRFAKRHCWGVGICEHHRQRSYCRECGGSVFFQHNRIKYTCREYSGQLSNLCEHRRRKYKECVNTTPKRWNIIKEIISEYYQRIFYIQISK